MQARVRRKIESSLVMHWGLWDQYMSPLDSRLTMRALPRRCATAPTPSDRLYHGEWHGICVAVRYLTSPERDLRLLPIARVYCFI
jgi:hypothetical protein